MLSEINQRDRGKYYTISLICGINKKKTQKEQIGVVMGKGVKEIKEGDQRVQTSICETNKSWDSNEWRGN